MIQYSNINDAWGNKEIFKKNILNNNLDIIGKPVAQISPKNDIPIKDVLLAPVENNNIPQVEKNIVVPITAPPNEPMVNNIEMKTNTQVKKIPQLNIPISNQAVNKEHFDSCSYAEHFKVCKACRDSLIEHFVNRNNANINIFGYKYSVSKDILKVIFILIIVAIFIILLSLVNIPIKDDLNIKVNPTQLKYLMMNQMHYPNGLYNM